MEDRYLDPQEVAELLGIHPKTVIRMIEAGKLPAADISLGSGKRRRLRVLYSTLTSVIKTSGKKKGVK